MATYMYFVPLKVFSSIRMVRVHNADSQFCWTSLDVVKKLIEAGANINQANKVGRASMVFSA